MSFKSQGDLMLCLEGAGMTNEACPTIISDIHQMQSTIQHM
jgi:hypothetical protein